MYEQGDETWRKAKREAEAHYNRQLRSREEQCKEFAVQAKTARDKYDAAVETLQRAEVRWPPLAVTQPPHRNRCTYCSSMVYACAMHFTRGVCGSFKILHRGCLTCFVCVGWNAQRCVCLPRAFFNSNTVPLAPQSLPAVIRTVLPPSGTVFSVCYASLHACTVVF